VLAFVPGWFARGYPGTYLVLIRRLSLLWHVCYWLLDSRAVYGAIQPLRRAWNRFAGRGFAAYVGARNPDAVLVTHFLPADVCNSLKRAGGWMGRLVVVVTDLHPHRFWLSPQADAYAAAVPRSAAVLQERGVPANRVHVTGIPVASAFGESRHASGAADRDPAVLRVLIMSGGTTVGRFEETVAAILRLGQAFPGRLRLDVVCGQAEHVRRRLEVRAAGQSVPVRVYGFVDSMAELMGGSDLIVAKAGGLTISEAVACGRPLILYHIVPGQEELNARYAADHGAAVIAPSPERTAEIVAACLTDPGRLAGLQRAAESMGKPDAATRIIAQVVQPLLEDSHQ
jgi:processive 1,2-diacylglycerol beta-glucosyltransferase